MVRKRSEEFVSNEGFDDKTKKSPGLHPVDVVQFEYSSFIEAARTIYTKHRSHVGN